MWIIFMTLDPCQCTIPQHQPLLAAPQSRCIAAPVSPELLIPRYPEVRPVTHSRGEGRVAFQQGPCHNVRQSQSAPLACTVLQHPIIPSTNHLIAHIPMPWIPLACLLPRTSALSAMMAMSDAT